MHQKLDLKELHKKESRSLSIYRWFQALSLGSVTAILWLAISTQWHALSYLAALNIWVSFLIAFEVLYRLRPQSAKSLTLSESTGESRVKTFSIKTRGAVANVFQLLLQLLPFCLSGAIVLTLLNLDTANDWKGNTDQLRLVGLVLVALAFAQHFLNQLAKALQQEVEQETLAYIRYLGIWSVINYLGTALVAFLWLYAQIDFSQGFCVFLAGSLVLISIERVVGLVGRYYQPEVLKETTGLSGKVYSLEFLFKYGAPWKNFHKQIEESYGIELGEIPALRMLQGKLEWAFLGGILVTWLSTCFTVIPLDSKGVRISFGRYDAEPVEPGLALSSPWPFGSVKKINTENTRFVSLGFAQDLGTPVLWNEKHFEGEYNLLVDGGNALLTINVPIYYKIKDPVAYLTHSQAPEETLMHLAYRRLLESTSYRDSFDIMLSSRESISNEMSNGLQREIDRLGLGFEVLFVGLKDIHPPVSVAPAYQAVVSAEEQKMAMIEKAKSYKAQMIPQTEQQTNRMRKEASQLAQSKKLNAEGQAKRFVLNQDQHQKTPYFMDSKLLYDTQTSVLEKSAKMLMLKESSDSSQYLMDLREHQWK